MNKTEGRPWARWPLIVAALALSACAPGAGEGDGEDQSSAGYAVEDDDAAYQAAFDAARQDLLKQWQEHRGALAEFPSHPDWVANLAPADGTISLTEPIGGPTMAELRMKQANAYADIGAGFDGRSGGPAGWGPIPTGLVTPVKVCDIIRWLAGGLTQLNPSAQNVLTGLSHTYLDMGVSVGLYTIAQMQAGVEATLDVYNHQSATFGWVGGGASTVIGASVSAYGGIGFNIPNSGDPYKSSVVEAWDGPTGSLSIGLSPIISAASVSPWASLPLPSGMYGVNAGFSTPTKLALPTILPVEFGFTISKYMHWNAATEAEHNVLTQALAIPNASLVRDPNGYYIQFTGPTNTAAAVAQSLHQMAQQGGQAIPAALIGLAVSLMQDVPAYVNACVVGTTPMPAGVSYNLTYFNNNTDVIGWWEMPQFTIQREPGTESQWGYFELEWTDGTFIRTKRTSCEADQPCTTADYTHTSAPSSSSGPWSFRVRRLKSYYDQDPSPWSFPQTFMPLIGASAGVYGPTPGQTLDFSKLTGLPIAAPIEWIQQYQGNQPYIKVKAGGGWTMWRPSMPSPTDTFGATADQRFHVFGIHPIPGDLKLPQGPVTVELGFARPECKQDILKCVPIEGSPVINETYIQP